MLSVMMVDDDPAILDVTRQVLERSHEITVRPVISAREALELLDKNSFDAIVLDYDLPEINGIEFLKIIRGKGIVTPVIIFTGVGRENAAISALNNGANFFLKKGENLEMPFIELQRMIRHAVDQRFMGKAKGLARKIVFDLLNFSLDAGFAIDPDGNVLVWNRAMEQLTGMPSHAVMEKGNYLYAEPFFGKRQKMLIDFVFSSDENIRKARYMVISREKNGPVVAVTRARKPDGTEWTLWMKATPLFDNHGEFVAAACIVRDVTTTFRDVSIEEESEAGTSPAAANGEAQPSGSGGFIDRILGRAMGQYKEGVVLYARNRNYRGAIEAFERAIEIDPKLPHVWNDRGICIRALGDYDEALKSFLRAVELSPQNPEILYELGETLEQMGVMQMNNRYIEAAVETFKMVVNSLPNNMDSWNHIGICLKELGKPEESKFYFDRARDIKLWKKDTPVPRKRNEFL
ncbi:putative PAS/PAC sensor protein [Methanoregula boonei 6A8]|jgi:DNA-binding response OmpR family regulator|uniref:Putative PAS/PAC sensor protein n=1 Tax=Methanoregula boonei (strain DSM 21154 / JCM 14090 / 6A8) TaxID=456442 RepID=A7I9Q3_METB6|nr:response regulator [Methanoregula boonei]ABS56464.1 putative PAS/PAC sensor protein [Methanoregula boonei 6A8]